MDVLGELQAVPVRQGDIHDHQIGAGGWDPFKGFGGGGGLPANHASWDLPDEPRQPIQEHGMVIDEKYPPQRASICLFQCSGHTHSLFAIRFPGHGDHRLYTLIGSAVDREAPPDHLDPLPQPDEAESAWLFVS